MSEPTLAEIYTAADAVQAHFLKNLLADAGIEARVVGDRDELHLGDSTAPRVWVMQADASRARELIEDWEQSRHQATPEQDLES